MLSKHFSQVSKAFSRKSLIYDSYEQNHEIVNWTRKQVYSQVLSYIKPGCKILELNAGTGKDAVFFATHGYNVHAIDISDGMLEKINSKISKYKLYNKLTLQKVSFTDIDQISTGPYDLIYSNFGGLNCIPDLRMVTKKISKKVLKIGGFIVWVIMPPICPWELASIFWNRKAGLRRLPSLFGKGTLANVEGVQFMTYYFRPRQVINAFGKDFVKIHLQSLSLFSPPSFLDKFPKRHSRIFNYSKWLDLHLSNLPYLNSCGDFFILTMQYLPDNL